MLSTNHHFQQGAFAQPIMTNLHCKQGAFDPETGSVRYICRLHCGASLASAKVDFVMMMMILVDFVMMMMIMVDFLMMMIIMVDLRVPQREI